MSTRVKNLNDFRLWCEMVGRMDGRVQGRVQEGVAGVFRVLKARGLSVPWDVARLLEECPDSTILGELQTRAVTIERGDDLFDSELRQRWEESKVSNVSIWRGVRCWRCLRAAMWT